MAARKRGCLGCSFPVLIAIIVFVVGLLGVGILSGPIGQGFLNAFGISLSFPDWLVVKQPAPELPAEVIATLGTIPGLGEFAITNTMLSAWLTTVFLVFFCWLATRKMQLVPGRYQMVFEFLLGWVYSFCESVAGQKNVRTFFPLVMTIFLFVMFNAYLGLLPFFGAVSIHTAHGEVHLFRPANTDINVPLALALVSFITVEVFGFRHHGVRYLNKFFNFGPLFRDVGQMITGKVKFSVMALFNGVINIGVGLLELLSEVIRILSLTFRLFGNMTAGEILLLLITFLVPFLISDAFYVLELLIGFVQALVFGGLTLVYLAMAVASHDAEEHA